MPKSPQAPERNRREPSVDATDRALLTELVSNSRISVRALAERVHISRAGAYARIERMLAEKTIRGFTARIDPARVGLGTTAYITLSINQAAWRSLCAALRSVPYVDHFPLVGAEFDVLVLVRAPDNEALRDVVLQELQALPGVRSSRTWLVFEQADGRGFCDPA
ncbi:Lrp/AsnC family transcriptional regulator [Streptomyces sp. NPDC051561]|uniref:Lrp/AsnC family transcriptional regulator n=1 Tax=Streptomyces sp. NPDC051561 TaxID=3365658 RepID=UPI0037877450